MKKIPKIVLPLKFFYIFEKGSDVFGLTEPEPLIQLFQLKINKSTDDCAELKLPKKNFKFFTKDFKWFVAKATRPLLPLY